VRRLAALVLASTTLAGGLVGCGAKVHTDPSPFDVDDPSAGAPPAPQAVRWEMRPEASPGPGARDGTIARAALNAVLDAGPGAFLHGFEVAAAMDRGRFTGWRLVQWMQGETRFAGLDLAPGDVLIAINGRPLSRPDQLEALWDSLRTANEVVCDLTRGDARFQLHFTIDPPLTATAAPSPPPPPPPAVVTVPAEPPPPPPPPPPSGKHLGRHRHK
jgi:hypothetical protein